MEQLSAIESYLQTLEFKKKGIGGCDEEDVFLKIKGLSELYQAEIERLERRAIAAEQRAAEFEKRSQEVRQLMAAAQNMKDTMLEKAKADSEKMVSAAEREAQTIVDNAAVDSDGILEKARVEADFIVSTAESEANDIRKAASSDADTRRAEAEADVAAFLEKDKQTRLDIKRQTDTAYAKAKVAKDTLEAIVSTLAEVQSEYAAKVVDRSADGANAVGVSAVDAGAVIVNPADTNSAEPNPIGNHA